jgi:hypothetical protein
VATSPTPSAALRYWNMARDRDIAAGWRDLETPACLCRPGRQAIAHSRAESRGFRPSTTAPGGRRTLRWKEPDSNHRSRLFKAASGTRVSIFLACGSDGPEEPKFPR